MANGALALTRYCTLMTGTKETQEESANIMITKSEKSLHSMLPGELTGIHYLAAESPIPFAANLGLIQQSNIPDFHFNRIFSNFHNPPFPQPVHEFTPQSSSLSNNSTSDEAEENQLSIIDERKQRRMISNRESARRSRMRKQKHLDELWSQVVRLRTENHNLIDKLNHVSECHDRVLQENARLKEEASDLRQMLTDLQIGSPFTASALRDLEEIPCNTAHLRAESSNQSISSSVDFLH
ncbi:hypothetical protein GH714_039991 [Hevea brasiliensis]|uniref:BZIP domain-containing protein n=2 Tax=Hevea brasiliensis TaxID=3981 RepID=A0A6A6MGC8_HEVBR|nr:hypothetical protein GH714_039991 [Hevea brasiliensis]